MNDVAEFIKIRQKIEFLATEIDARVGRKVPQSRTKLDEAAELLAKLTAMADNDVQLVAVTRLTRLLTKLGTKVGTPKTKTVRSAEK